MLCLLQSTFWGFRAWGLTAPLRPLVSAIKSLGQPALALSAREMNDYAELKLVRRELSEECGRIRAGGLCTWTRLI